LQTSNPPRQGGNRLIPLLLTTDSPDGGDWRLGIDKVAVHVARRVDLALRPVRVLPLTFLAREVQVDATFGLEERLLLGACPGLVDPQLARGPRVGEGGSPAGAIILNLAVVDDSTKEEFGELVGRGGADGAVVDGRVLEGEVDVAPGILMSGCGEDLGGVVVELCDLPELEMLGNIEAGLLARGVCGDGEGRACEEEGVEDAGVHICGRY
jgi:hypothetical protein